MKFNLTDKEAQCGFKVYDKKSNAMVDCGTITNVFAGNTPICCDHLADALQRDKRPDMEDCRLNKEDPENKKGFIVIEFVSDFITLAKGNDINIKQTEMNFDEPVVDKGVKIF